MVEDEVGQSKGKPQELCTPQKRDRLMGMRSLSGMERIFSTIPGSEQKGRLQRKGQEEKDEKGIAELLSRRIFLGANVFHHPSPGHCGCYCCCTCHPPVTAK